MYAHETDAVIGRAPKQVHSSDLLELRLSSLDLALAGTFALAVLVMVVPDPFLVGDIAPTGNVTLCLLASVLISLAFRGRWVTVASIVLVTSLGGSLVLALRLFSPDATVPWFALLVLVGTTLLGKRGGIAVAVASSAFLAFGLPALSIAITDQAVRSAQAMVWTAVALSWLITHPLYTALDWSWSSYQQALAKTREAEHHRGDLVRALKGLNEAYHRLGIVNRELARARQAADEARKLKARFAAFVSHELRLPLNIITGFSEMMVMSPGSYDGQTLPPTYRSDVEAIYRAAYHLSSLIDDVLDLSEIEAHQMGLQKEWTSLAEVVDEAGAAVSGLFQNKGLALAVDVPPDLPAIYADRTRIRQVVMNLLRNAARFTDAGGAQLSATVRDRDVVVDVADTGIGIAPGDLPHVFEEFRQLEAAGQRRAGGSGLGLTISKQFVEMHGGNMWVESRFGKGTTFRFSLPVSDNVAASAIRDPWDTWADAIPHPTQGDDAVVAVLGQDQQVLRLLQRYLEGYRLIPAAHAEALRQIADEHVVQAVIVTETDGQHDRKAVSEVLSRGPAVPVIMCSVHLKRPEAARGLGVAEYLVKPVERERLGSALAALGEINRVVVVDDDPEMARLLAVMVRSLAPHRRVWFALDGEEALDLIETHRPQAVLLDLLMPGMDGYEVLRRLRSSPDLRPIPVIVVTAGTAIGESVTAEISTITREGGLAVPELIHCLRSALDSLLSSPDTRRGPPGAHAA
ncbi:MAG: response regulator [Chloroflexi bacterium]|nr:response regulator [Chloroflexota bacterium]